MLAIPSSPSSHLSRLLFQTIVGVVFGFAAGAVIKTFNPSKQARSRHASPSAPLMQPLQVISAIALFGDVFLNLLKMMVLPLIMCSMITGVTSIRSTGSTTRPSTAHVNPLHAPT